MARITQADGVFQGGGVKGLALAGALLGFAEGKDVAITEWVNVAGTSAGAIIAAYLATGHSPADVEQLLRRLPFKQFQDWGRGGKVIGGAINLVRRHGLAHGEYFRTWFDNEIGHKTFASVRREQNATDKAGDPYRLRLVATDVTQRKMLVLPADLSGYRLPGTKHPIVPDDFPIASAVRMSMSMPYFFEPVVLESVETGVLCAIVDGAVLSNFPVWLFDASHDVGRPTFGFHLVSGDGNTPPKATPLAGARWPAQLAADMFHTASEAWDQRFMSHSTVVRTCTVPAGTTQAADFGLTSAQQAVLIDGGRRAATAFLEQFQVSDYVNTYGYKIP